MTPAARPGDVVERERFEAWALLQWPGREIKWSQGAEVCPFLHRSDTGEQIANLRWEWSAWQAAIRSLLPARG